MKNFLYTTIFLFTFSTTYAQLQQGSFFLSGRLEVQAINQDGGAVFSSSPLMVTGASISSTRVEIAPSIGYLFAGNLAGGLELSYSHSSTTVEQPSFSSIFPQTQESSLNLFTVRPYMRYYKNLGDKFGFQLDIFGGLGFGKSTADRLANSSLQKQKENISSFELGLSPGLYYFISPRFMIDASIGGIGYESEKASPADPAGAPSRQSSRFYTFLDSGVGLRVGVNLFFYPGRE
ncbi:MAG: outer membrane beta-barrel protein [Lewinellaceae bacterium]|nr:outer membrane beta-barrel protein [Lewinellaceae bacterium]